MLQTLSHSYDAPPWYESEITAVVANKQTQQLLENIADLQSHPDSGPF
jgi:hypothetical protein